MSLLKISAIAATENVCLLSFAIDNIAFQRSFYMANPIELNIPVRLPHYYQFASLTPTVAEGMEFGSNISSEHGFWAERIVRRRR